MLSLKVSLCSVIHYRHFCSPVTGSIQIYKEQKEESWLNSTSVIITVSAQWRSLLSDTIIVLVTYLLTITLHISPITTQPESWYSLYHPTGGRKLSWPSSWLPTEMVPFTCPRVDDYTNLLCWLRKHNINGSVLVTSTSATCERFWASHGEITCPTSRC